MGHPQIDKACLLQTCNDFDGMSEDTFSLADKRRGTLCHAQGIGACCPHGAWRHGSQALTKAFQAGQSTVLCLNADLAILIKTGPQAYHFTQTVDDPKLAVFHSGNDHMKTV